MASEKEIVETYNNPKTLSTKPGTTQSEIPVAGIVAGPQIAVQNKRRPPPPPAVTDRQLSVETETGPATWAEYRSSFCISVTFWGIVVVIVLAALGVFTDATPTASPTVQPTSDPSAVVVCPPVFTNDVVEANVDCRSQGCGGSIEWCGLDDARNYSLLVEINGHYAEVGSNVTLNIFGNRTVTIEKTTLFSCIIFAQVFDDIIRPTGGTLLLTFDNNDLVNPVCFGASSRVQTTLTQLP